MSTSFSSVLIEHVNASERRIDELTTRRVDDARTRLEMAVAAADDERKSKFNPNDIQCADASLFADADESDSEEIQKEFGDLIASDEETEVAGEDVLHDIADNEFERLQREILERRQAKRLKVEKPKRWQPTSDAECFVFIEMHNALVSGEFDPTSGHFDPSRRNRHGPSAHYEHALRHQDPRNLTLTKRSRYLAQIERQFAHTRTLSTRIDEWAHLLDGVRMPLVALRVGDDNIVTYVTVESDDFCARDGIGGAHTVFRVENFDTKLWVAVWHLTNFRLAAQLHFQHQLEINSLVSSGDSVAQVVEMLCTRRQTIIEDLCRIIDSNTNLVQQQLQ